MSLARGEFTAAEYGQKAKKNTVQVSGRAYYLIIIIIIIIAIVLRKSGGSNHKTYQHRRITILVASGNDEFRKRFSQWKLGRIFGGGGGGASAVLVVAVLAAVVQGGAGGWRSQW